MPSSTGAASRARLPLSDIGNGSPHTYSANLWFTILALGVVGVLGARSKYVVHEIRPESTLVLEPRRDRHR
jgi:hypothetical protein